MVAPLRDAEARSPILRVLYAASRRPGSRPEGRLRYILTLARHTGRRENAICQLLASDVLRSQDDVEAVLSALGLDERQAQYFPPRRHPVEG